MPTVKCIGYVIHTLTLSDDFIFFLAQLVHTVWNIKNTVPNFRFSGIFDDFISK